MKARISTTVAATVGASFAIAGALTIGVGSASATPAPTVPFTDPQVVGGAALFNYAGAPITSGSLTDDATFPLTVGSKIVRATNNSADLFVATPKSGVTANNWVEDQLGDSEQYTQGQPTTQHGVAGAGLTLGQYIGFDPGARNTATDAYAGLYQLRLIGATVGGGADPTYQQAVIKVTEGTPMADGTATGTWTLVEPLVTSTSLVVTPASPAAAGTSVTLTSTTSNGGAGMVTFKDGATTLGTASADPNTGVAMLPAYVPASGSHSYTATYVPTAPTAFDASASPATAYTVSQAVVTPPVTTPPASLPEAPYALLIPLLGAAVGGGVLMSRRRKALH